MGISIAANLISYVIILIVSTLLIGAVLRLTHRNRLLKFFGTDKSRRIVIYLSNIRVTSFGAIGIDGTRRSYAGSAAAFMELLAANRFKELFNYLIPALSDFPNILSKILYSDTQVQISLSPLNYGEIEKSTAIITIGSPAYNIVSEYVEKEFHTTARVSSGIVYVNNATPVDPADIDWSSITTSPSTIQASGTAAREPRSVAYTDSHEEVSFSPPGNAVNQLEDKKSEINIDGLDPITNPNYGFIERIIDRTNKRYIFYVAGLSEAATAGAANYLANNWSYLTKYKDEKFIVVIRMDHPSDKYPKIILERQ